MLRDVRDDVPAYEEEKNHAQVSTVCEEMKWRCDPVVPNSLRSPCPVIRRQPETREMPLHHQECPDPAKELDEVDRPTWGV